MRRKYQVGGVVYEILQTKAPSKKKFDIKSMKSMIHEPIQIEEVLIKGYEPQYKFNRTLENEDVPITPIVTSKPAIAQLVFNAGAPSNNTIVTNSSNLNENVWNEVWQKYGSQLGLKDTKAYLYLLGQVKHESDDFKYMEEIADGSAYEGRKDLGNTHTGDGKRYKGRGPIQVTGRSNYEKIYNEFFVPNGLDRYDIVNNPELANDPEIGALLSIGWFVTTENGKKAISAANNYDIEGMTYAINGGYNGLEDRIKKTNDLLKEYT